MDVDEATFRILDTLSSEMGSPISIHQLTSKIRQRYGTGYYARIYNKLIELSEQGLITITKAGRSSIPSLNFASYALLDMLSEIEMRKKREFMDGNRTLRPLILDIETCARGNPRIESMCITSPERNARLNRAELLILNQNASASSSENKASIHRAIMEIQHKNDIRTDALLLSPEDFSQLLASNEINPLREMISNKIAFHAPQAFWAEVADTLAKGRTIRLLSEETNPARIAENDLLFNLDRFGYREFGTRIDRGRNICLEYIICSILMKGDARRTNAIPALLSKNAANLNLLIFLLQKYSLSAILIRFMKGKGRPQGIARITDAMREFEGIGRAKMRSQ